VSEASVNFNGWLVRFLLLDQWDVSAYEAHILEAARRGHRVLKHVLRARSQDCCFAKRQRKKDIIHE
jgi:hypothetical protein